MAKKRTTSLPLPPPIPPDKCRENRLKYAWFLPEYASKRNANTTYWRKRPQERDFLLYQSEEFLRSEMEFWKEMELLSGQRQRYKPGVTEESVKQDDEVCESRPVRSAGIATREMAA